MGARGPKPGSGGRPRTATPKANQRDGRKRITVGPPGHGTQVSEARAKVGLKPGNPLTVQHKDHNTSNDAASNLSRMSRSANVVDGNKHRGKRKK